MINVPTVLAATEPELWFVCALGIAVVFVGLICIIGIIMIMNLLCNSALSQKNVPAEKDDPIAVSPVSATPATPVASAPIENRSEIVAAVVAAIAEEEGTDISAIRVISFKKIN